MYKLHKYLQSSHYNPVTIYDTTRLKHKAPTHESTRRDINRTGNRARSDSRPVEMNIHDKSLFSGHRARAQQRHLWS